MQKIKIEGEWRNIVAVYKKVNNQWVQQDEYDFDNIPHFYSDAMVDVGVSGEKFLENLVKLCF